MLIFFIAICFILANPLQYLYVSSASSVEWITMHQQTVEPLKNGSQNVQMIVKLLII